MIFMDLIFLGQAFGVLDGKGVFTLKDRFRFIFHGKSWDVSMAKVVDDGRSELKLFVYSSQ